MIKDYLLSQKQKRNSELDDLAKRVEALEKVNNESKDEKELKAAGEELDQLKQKKAELEKELQEIDQQIAELDKPADPKEGEGERNKFNPNIMTRGKTNMDKNLDQNNIELRMAFARYVTRGTPIPTELRADANTNTSNVSSAIPENLYDQIVSELRSLGMVMPLITKTSYAVGQTIPTDGVKPTAAWVSEGASSDTQNKVLGSIVFGAFKLRCEVSFTQEVSVQTIAAFEQLFVKQVAEAMVVAIESKICSADSGAANPTGILYDAGGNDAKVEILKLATGHLDYKALCDAEGLLPAAYEQNAKWTMTKKTFMSIYSLIDSNGQPIGRINYGMGGKPERTLLGRDVVIVPYLPDYTEATATEDKVVAYLFDYNDYVLNTSYDLGIKSKEDWDTEDHRIKAVMSVDGKVIDRHSLVKIVKKYA